MKNAVIIGSGFGGLALAIKLQAAGYRVKLFEKNAQVGGHAQQIKEKGYTFDMGPSLITAPDIIQDIFAAAGKDMNDYIDLEELTPNYRIYFHDKTYIDYSGDRDSMMEQMAKFNPADAANYDSFIENSKKIYDAVITDGLGAEPFNKLGTMASFLPRALKLKALNSAYGLASKYFQDKRNRFVFSFHPLFIGGNPFRVPAIYLMIPYLEKAGGVWYSKGGMYSLVEAFEKVFRELGGEVFTNSEVEEIVTENGRAIGVRANGEFHKAGAVISNADVTHTYGKLLNNARRKKWTDSRLKKSKYSMSAFLLYLGVKKKYKELIHHTLILSERYKELIADIFDNKILPEDFSLYMHAPSITDSSMAPEGCESIYMLAPVANLSGNINWAEMNDIFADRIIDFLEKVFGLKDLRENIEVKLTYNPEDFKRERNSHLGSPWGLEPVLRQSAYFRPHNVSEDIENLYFVGAGTHPGAGLPGVMLSAEAAKKLILGNGRG